MASTRASLECSDLTGRTTRCRHSSVKYSPSRYSHAGKELAVSVIHCGIQLATLGDNLAARAFSCRIQVANNNPVFFSVAPPNYSQGLSTWTLVVFIFSGSVLERRSRQIYQLFCDKFDFRAGARVAFHVSVILTLAFIDPAGLVRAGRPVSSFSHYLINARARYCSRPRYRLGENGIHGTFKLRLMITRLHFGDLRAGSGVTLSIGETG